VPRDVHAEWEVIGKDTWGAAAVRQGAL